MTSATLKKQGSAEVSNDDNDPFLPHLKHDFDFTRDCQFTPNWFRQFEQRKKKKAKGFIKKELRCQGSELEKDRPQHHIKKRSYKSEDEDIIFDDEQPRRSKKRVRFLSTSSSSSTSKSRSCSSSSGNDDPNEDTKDTDDLLVLQTDDNALQSSPQTRTPPPSPTTSQPLTSNNKASAAGMCKYGHRGQFHRRHVCQPQQRTSPSSALTLQRHVQQKLRHHATFQAIHHPTSPCKYVHAPPDLLSIFVALLKVTLNSQPQKKRVIKEGEEREEGKKEYVVFSGEMKK